MSPYFQISEAGYGSGVFARTNLAPLTPLVRFTGPIVPLHEVPPHEINYVVRITRDTYLIPEAPARLFNHSCSPNCAIDDDFQIVTMRPIAKGEQLTFAYNQITPEEAAQWGSFWHPGWTFECGCGSGVCVGTVDRYLVIAGGIKIDQTAMTETPTRPDDVPYIIDMAQQVGTFTDEEIACLKQDIDGALKAGSKGEDDDLIMTIRHGDEIMGFTQCGRVPMTNQSWMLYWILLAPKFHGRGIGGKLIQLAERQARTRQARLLMIETSDQATFASARRLYEKCGYRLAASIPEFYDDQHAKCVFSKNL